MNQKSKLGRIPWVSSLHIFEDQGMCKKLSQHSMGKKTVSVEKNKPSAIEKVDLSVATRLVALEECMGSFSREIESLCISEGPLQ